MKYVIILLPVILLATCKKPDAENLIAGTWTIQSVTFNGIEKKNDLLLHGVTNYVIEYGLKWSQISPAHGMMQALTANDSVFLSFPFALAGNDTFWVWCSYHPDPFLDDSYLPYMIDSSLSFCGDEAWKIILLNRHTFISQLIYQGNTYIFTLAK